jgi:bifunctional DNase/RNase
MIPVKVLTLLITGTANPAVLVLEPVNEAKSGKSRIIPIWIGINEAMQVGLAIEHIKPPRPTTHDLFLDALTNLDTYIDHVEIIGFNNQTFFTKLFIREHSRLIELDARPTDAIALAVREGAPLLISEEVADYTSFPFMFNGEESRDTELKHFQSFLNTVTPDDFVSQAHSD